MLNYYPPKEVEVAHLAVEVRLGVVDQKVVVHQKMVVPQVVRREVFLQGKKVVVTQVIVQQVVLQLKLLKKLEVSQTQSRRTVVRFLVVRWQSWKEMVENKKSVVRLQMVL